MDWWSHATFKDLIGYAIVGIVYLALRRVDGKQDSEIKVLGFQTRTLWEFIMRRALAEALKGVVDMNSPIVINESARSKFSRIEAPLKKWYIAEGMKLDRNPDSTSMSDVRDLYIQTEHQFGDRLLMEVCNPHHMSFGECIWGAIALMREVLQKQPPPDSDQVEDTEMEPK